MPDLDANKTSTRKKASDGESYLEESIWEPGGEKQWKQTMTVFRTTLLMCLAGNPNQTKLKLTKVSLDDFYEWLYGDQMLTRSRAPSLKVVMYTERKAWRKISIMVHEGLSLEAALKKMRDDSMFWIVEAYERVNQRNNGERTNRSRSPGRYWDPPGNKSERGMLKNWDPRVNDKVKWPKNWATFNPKGREYCKMHLVHYDCPGKCGRSHSCPILRADGAPCNGNHVPRQHYAASLLRSRNCPIRKADGSPCNGDNVPGPHY
jgi:hypothetical protein